MANFLDFIFPKRCVNCKKYGSYLCENCFIYLSFDTEGVCAVCNRPTIDNLTHPRCSTRYTIDGIFSSISYKGIAKKLVYNFKYKPFISDLSTLLTDLFYEGLIQKEEFYNIQKKLRDKPVLVPVPLHPSRLRERGYNQSEILAKGLAERMNLKVLNCLRRTKLTKPQANLSKKERKKNIMGAFEVFMEKEKLKNLNVFLIDDIFTTGLTLNEAAKTLKKAGVRKVWGLTLARD